MSDIPKKKLTVASRTEYHRMHFLLQAADLMSKQFGAAANPAQPDATSQNEPEEMSQDFASSAPEIDSGQPRLTPSSKQHKNRERLDLPEFNIARNLTTQARLVGQKAVLRTDSETKRQICKKCQLQLTPGSTCSVRVRRDKSKKLFKTTTCSSCGFASRIRMDASHKIRSADAAREEIS